MSSVIQSHNPRSFNLASSFSRSILAIRRSCNSFRRSIMLPIERLVEAEVSLELITALRGYIIWFPILGNSRAAALPDTMRRDRCGIYR
jgi:hypothetical protein